MTTADFSHLRVQAVTKDHTADITLYSVVGEPTLTVRPASEANKLYFNAVLKRQGRNVKRLKAAKISVAMLAENRDEDRELFPKYIIVGWSKNPPLDVEGNEAPFSLENCVAFVDALPDDQFDEVRDFAANLENFRDDVVDVEETGKNSQSGSSGN